MSSLFVVGSHGEWLCSVFFVKFCKMIRRRNVLTASELQAEIDSWTSDEEGEENGHNADEVNIIITPPNQVDDISDDEEIDDNVQILHDQHQLPNEMAGQFELEYIYEDGNEHLPPVGDTVEIEPNEPEELDVDEEEPTTSRSRSRPVRRPSINRGAKWSHAKSYKFDKQPINTQKDDQKALFEKIG